MRDYIWRYLDDFKTDYLLKQKNLYISRIDVFEEEYNEGFFTLEEKKQIRATHSNPEALFSRIKNSKKKAYVSCWCKTESESKKMWEEYMNQSGNGIAIKTTRSKLKKVIEEHLPDDDTNFIDVKYIDPVKIDLPRVNIIDLYSRKIDEDRFENEFRALVQFYDKAHYSEKLEIPLNLNHFIDEIVLSPFCNKSYLDETRRQISKVLSIEPISSKL